MPDRFFQIGGENIRVEQTGGFITMDYNHEMIHLGNMYTVDNYGTVANGGTLQWLVTPGTAYNLHTAFGINVTGAGRVYLYENPTGSAGSALTAYNMNRDSTATCSASFASTPSVTDIGGTVALMNGIYIPAGAGVANRVGGGLRSDQEFILDSGKKYLYRYVNISGADGTVSWYVSAYEEESEA